MKTIPTPEFDIVVLEEKDTVMKAGGPGYNLTVSRMEGAALHGETLYNVIHYNQITESQARELTNVEPNDELNNPPISQFTTRVQIALQERGMELRVKNHPVKPVTEGQTKTNIKQLKNISKGPPPPTPKPSKSIDPSKVLIKPK